MAITTSKVYNPKVNGVYQVSDVDLKINLKNPKQHNVIVTSINKKRGTCTVKTITSLEDRKEGKYFFRNGQLDAVKKGDILVISKAQLRTNKLSGINHKRITIKIDKLHYKEPNDLTRFPNRYHDLIHRK